MLFPTHLAAAALVGRQSGLSVWWLLVGATVPDAVDKGLATLGVVDLFHTVGHTALLVLLLVPAATRGRRWLALAVGWGSHVALDAVHIAVNGRFGDLAFLTWPLVRPADPLALAPLPFVSYYLGSPSFYLEFVIWGLLVVVLVRDDGALRSGFDWSR